MFAAIGRSLSFLSRKEQIIYFALVATRGFASLLDIAGIALIGLLAGLAASSLDPSDQLSILGFKLPSVDQQTLVLLVCVVLAVFLFKAGVSILLGRVLTKFLARIESNKSAQIAEYLFMGDLDKVQSLSKGDILWALIGSVSMTFSGLLMSLSTFITEGVLLLLVAATFFIVDPVATAFVFIYFGIVIAIIQFLIGNSLKNAGLDSARGNSQSIVVVDDMLGAFREITILGKKEFFIEKFQVARHKLASSNGTMVFLGGMPRYVVETALMLGVVAFVGFQFVTGQLSTGLVTVGVFLTGGVRIMASLLPLQGAISNVQNQTGQSEMAQTLLAESALHSDSTPVPKAANLEHFPVSGNLAERVDRGLSVLIRDASYSYPGSASTAISNIDLEILPGQHVAIIGPSGAGKTTLVDLVLGLMEPTAGEVLTGNVPPALSEKIHPGLISYVPQSPGIVSGTIAENVALGVPLDDINEERVQRALEKAFLSDFVNDLPDGIYSSVGSQADSLSGGQVQRLGLARALYNSPKLLVLDEATSALDATSEAYISASIRDLGDDVTVIVIAHRLSTVQHSDVVYVLEDGRITASGSFKQLRKTVPLVAEYVELMSFDEL